MKNTLLLLITLFSQASFAAEGWSTFKPHSGLAYQHGTDTQWNSLDGNYVVKVSAESAMQTELLSVKTEYFPEDTDCGERIEAKCYTIAKFKAGSVNLKVWNSTETEILADVNESLIFTAEVSEKAPKSGQCGTPTALSTSSSLPISIAAENFPSVTFKGTNSTIEATFQLNGNYTVQFNPYSTTMLGLGSFHSARWFATSLEGKLSKRGDLNLLTEEEFRKPAPAQEEFDPDQYDQ